MWEKCHVNETLKKRIITVILKSTYFDLKKKTNNLFATMK